MVPIEEHITDMHINKYNLKAIFLRYMEDLDDLIDSIMLGWINI